MPSRQRAQAEFRNQGVTWVCNRLERRLSTVGELRRMHSTNRLFPQGHLGHQKVRQLFAGWILQYVGNGRAFTQKFADDVCTTLRHRFGLPKLTGEARTGERDRCQTLLKSARKRKLDKRRAMDTSDTLPLVPEARLIKFLSASHVPGDDG